MAAPPASPDAFQEAVAAWRKRFPITDAELDQLTDELKEYAFTVAGATQADLVTQVYDALDSAIANGTTFEDFKDAVGDQLAESWGGDDPGRLETVFRTNVMSAYNDGRYDILNSDQVRESHPYQRLDVIDDDRTSDICQHFISPPVVLPADDPFWATHHPPLHHNCRTIITPLTQDNARKEGIREKGPDVSAADGFGDAPSKRGDDWEPDVSSYPEEIRGILSRRLDEGP